MLGRSSRVVGMNSNAVLTTRGAISVEQSPASFPAMSTPQLAEPGDVSARPRQALDKPPRDGVERLAP